MAATGFEGFEKRLELGFHGDDPMGLRRLRFDQLQQVLDEVQCSVVSAVGNRFFDAYVLSESSLFVYPRKVIVKTCGTTQLLRAIPRLLRRASELGLSACACRYTRGSFIFPDAQPFPHTSFRAEVGYLEENLPTGLRYRKACIMPSTKTSHSWHVYTASDGHPIEDHDHDDDFLVGHYPVIREPYTVEVCMTQLDQTLARKFYRRQGDRSSGDGAGKEMTASTGIGEINPGALVCDFAFDPCGYSMNSVDGPRYSTIHVTPEDGYSYASFECVASGSGLGEILKRAIRVFRPAVVSVSISTSDSGRVVAEACSSVAAAALRQLGYDARGCRAEDFPAAGTVTFQTFSACRM